MKKIITPVISLAILLFFSCERWLDVTDSSQVREEQQFSSEAGFRQALLGCYIDMAQDTLYGIHLSWYLPDNMTQTYNPYIQSYGGIAYYFQQHAYTTSRSVPYVEGIWEQSYNVIANANNALKFTEKNKHILHSINHDIIKGELLAIRAWMHFDILRLYGYGNLANRPDMMMRLSIPYVTQMSKEITEQSTHAEVLAYIINDLKEAITLLEIDPITGNHPDSFYDEVNFDGFYNNRNLRLNYYAAKALLARVYLWEGSDRSLEQARTLATELIAMNEDRGLFPWVIDNMDRDRGFYSEQLFGLNVSNLKNYTLPYFLLEFLETTYSVLYFKASSLAQIYEIDAGGGVDLRFGKLFQTNSSGNVAPLKIVTDGTYPRVSMIRLPELYYIAAECYGATSTPDYAEAKRFIRIIREKRGLSADFTCDDEASFREELRKEYLKEFISEGILFYYYKRVGQEIIITPAGATLEMDDAKYNFPYPAFEIQSGRIQ
jgi:hypothetical protein